MARQIVVMSILAIVVSCAFDCIPNPRPEVEQKLTPQKDPIKDKDGLLSEHWEKSTNPVVKQEDGWHYKILTDATSSKLGTSIVRVDFDYNPNYASGRFTSEDKLYYEVSVDDHCVFDGKYYYFKKKFSNVNVLCPEITGVTARAANSKDPFPVTEITSSLSDADWAKVIGAFDALPVQFNGRTGTEWVRGLKTIETAQWIVSKRVKTSVRPFHDYFRIILETDELSKIYKCVRYAGHHYTIRYYHPNSVSKQANLAAHKLKKPSERVKVYIKIANALKAVHDKGVIEGELDPVDYKFLDNGNVWITHTLDMTPIDGTRAFGLSGINRPFRAKEDSSVARPLDDIYLLAMFIVSMEVGDTSTTWKQEFGTTTEASMDGFPVNNLEDPKQYINKIVNGNLKQIHGEADPKAEAPVDGNLTSLVLYVLNKAPDTYTVDQFIQSLNKVLAALVQKNQRNLELKVVDKI